MSPRSLWRLSFARLYIEGPQLDVRLDALGKLHVAGLAHVHRGHRREPAAPTGFSPSANSSSRAARCAGPTSSRRAEPLLLTDLRFVSRNGGRAPRLMRLDATPPAGWGERFSLRGRFRQPLLSVRSGNWQSWDGQLYAELPHIDVRRLGRYVSLDARIREGRAALRLWADVGDGQVVGRRGRPGARPHRCLARQGASSRWCCATSPAAWPAQLNDRTLEFSTTALQFETADGMRWPGWQPVVPALAGARAARRSAAPCGPTGSTSRRSA